MQSRSGDPLEVSPLCWWECMLSSLVCAFGIAHLTPFRHFSFPPCEVSAQVCSGLIGLPLQYSGAAPLPRCPSLVSCLENGGVSCCWNFDLSFFDQEACWSVWALAPCALAWNLPPVVGWRHHMLVFNHSPALLAVQCLKPLLHVCV